jgi:acid phosphatase
MLDGILSVNRRFPFAALVSLLLGPLFADGVPRPDHVVIVVEENHDFGDIIGDPDAPYLNSLAAAGALFTDSHGIEHPSQPNYLDLFSGSNQGVKSDSCPHTFCTANLATALIEAGFTFGGYSEDLPSVGSTKCSSGKYYRKHNPWVNFRNVPKDANLPFTSWPVDFSQLPTLSFVIPNQSHDMHDGTVNQADTWLKENLDAYREWAMSHNSLLIVTWDEGDSGNHIPTIFIGEMVRPGPYEDRIDHFDVLRTLADMYGLARMGESRNATPIANVWTATQPPPDCNQNGVGDDRDIQGGTSRDENQDAIPDECQGIQGRIELVQGESGCVLVVLENEVAIRSGEFGIGYDPKAVVPTGVRSAIDLPSSAEVLFDPSPELNCAPKLVAGGITVGWTNSGSEDALITPGRHTILQICFDLPRGKYRGVSRPLKFVDCLGACGAPVKNVVTDPAGIPQLVLTRGGDVNIPGKPIFRRGDANEDGSFDISDAVVNLNCRFLGTGCPACSAEMDVNDDDSVDISDGVYLLSWLILAGPTPPPPFPDCGPDDTPGSLPVCVEPASCR